MVELRFVVELFLAQLIVWLESKSFEELNKRTLVLKFEAFPLYQARTHEKSNNKLIEFYYTK
jgi:hypothetical protein